MLVHHGKAPSCCMDNFIYWRKQWKRNISIFYFFCLFTQHFITAMKIFLMHKSFTHCKHYKFCVLDSKKKFFLLCKLLSNVNHTTRPLETHKTLSDNSRCNSTSIVSYSLPNSIEKIVTFSINKLNKSYVELPRFFFLKTSGCVVGEIEFGMGEKNRNNFRSSKLPIISTKA